ncbi:MAG: capsule assembly Wzi family protein [Bacteroidota bacterium]
MKIPQLFGTLTLGLIMYTFSYGQTQVVYVPLHHPVYDYLERLTIESIVDWDGLVQPASRIEVAQRLLQAEAHKSKLSDVELDELLYYEKEFRPELLALGRSQSDTTMRWHLFSYEDSSFSTYLDPILGETVSKGDSHLFNGAEIEGTAGSSVGYGFRFYDNTEKGSNIDRVKQYVPETGIDITNSTGPQEIEYDEVGAYVSYGSSKLQLSVGKGFVEWGSGNGGKLILSDKAPEFPMIRLDYFPVPWLTFHYMHGWLQSLVIDSLLSYQTSLPYAPRNIYREKYIAAHMLSLRPITGFEFSLGESIIYSDGPPNILFLIPVMFFRAADHYLSHTSQNDGNNSQFFFDAKYDFLDHFRTYGTLFIDEIDTYQIFNPSKARNQLGFTLGTRILNPPFKNVDVIIEYTRILPWVYSNSVAAQTYESDGYLLGDYIGQNADQIYTEVNWRPFRPLGFSAYYDYVRRGGMTDVQKEYELPSLPFLYGQVERATIKGAAVTYEPLHDLIAKCDLFWQNPYTTSNSFNVRLTLEYGLELR